MQRDSCTTLDVISKKPISWEKKKIMSTKIQILSRKFFPEWFGHKEIEHICFRKTSIKNQLKLIFQKICEFWSWKGSNISTLSYTLYEKSFQIWDHFFPLLFPQGFQKSKIFGHRTSGSGGKKTVKRSEKVWWTNKQTNKQTDTHTDFSTYRKNWHRGPILW